MTVTVLAGHRVSRRCYQRGCHTPACRRANATYKETRRAHAVPAFVGPDRVRQHLDWLATQGLGRAAVAARAGVHDNTVRRIRSGCRHRLRPTTERALLSVLPDAAADHALVDAGRTWDAIGLLVGAGWSRAQIARQVHGPHVRRLRVGRVSVTRRTERVVLEVAATVARRVEIPVRAGSSAAVDVSDWFEADESWRRRRACRGRDPRVFMPGRGDQDAIVKAQRLCGRCPVRESCLAFALARPAVVGVWGASTEHERAVMRRDARRVAS